MSLRRTKRPMVSKDVSGDLNIPHQEYSSLCSGEVRHEPFLRMVDDWRRGQIDVPSRAEAIRRMVELAAKMKKKPDTDR